MLALVDVVVVVVDVVVVVVSSSLLSASVSVIVVVTPLLGTLVVGLSVDCWLLLLVVVNVTGRPQSRETRRAEKSIR